MPFERRAIVPQKSFPSSSFCGFGMKPHSGSIDPLGDSRLERRQKLHTWGAGSTVQSVTRTDCQEPNRLFLSCILQAIDKRFATQLRPKWPIHCGCTPSSGKKVNTTPMQGPERRREV